jgi:hypothetical protein
MISGTALLLTLLWSANPPPAAADAAPAAAQPAVEQLVVHLGRPAPASSVYTEVRFVHLLRKPLVLHGQLDYNGATRLGKRVDAPYHETTTIADGAVQVQREGRAPRQFELARAPELEALLASFSALLGGDAAALQRYYDVQLVENAANWTLTLKPRDAGLARHLRDIVVDGAATEPRCFTLHESGADASVLLLGALAAAQLPDAPTPDNLNALCRSAP